MTRDGCHRELEEKRLGRDIGVGVITLCLVYVCVRLMIKFRFFLIDIWCIEKGRDDFWILVPLL